MQRFTISDDGTVWQNGGVTAYVDSGGATIRGSRGGRVIAYVEDDGTIKSDSDPHNGVTLGYVAADGTITHLAKGYQVLGHVEPPNMRLQAALLLVR